MNGAHYDKNEEPIVISKPTTDRLLKLDRPADAMALYWFYYSVAKWRHTDCIWANNNYVTQGLKWTDNRLSKAKRDLLNLNLIEQCEQRWNPATKKFGRPLIKINFIWWSREKIDESCSPRNQPPQETAIAGIEGTNRRSTNKEVKRYIIRSKESLCPTEERSDDVCWVNLATLLSKVVRLEHKLATPPQKIKAWAKELKRLWTVEKVSFDRAKAAMQWYAENYNAQGKYSLVIECGRTFREKFARLEKAMKRDGVTGSSILQESNNELPNDNSDYGNMMGIKDKDFVR